MTIYTNDLKKGTRVRLANGFGATLVDNKKGNIREARVDGPFVERGSIYSHDIVWAFLPSSGAAESGSDGWVRVTHTPSQLSCKMLDAALFG